MKAGWKTRIEERRYFEEKRSAWEGRVAERRISELRWAAEVRKLELLMDRAGRPTLVAYNT